jgi:hypothetical protein
MGSVEGARRYLALREGRPAGGAGWRPADGLAQLTGAATLPAHRRKGVQSALLAARWPEPAVPLGVSSSQIRLAGPRPQAQSGMTSVREGDSLTIMTQTAGTIRRPRS